MIKSLEGVTVTNIMADGTECKDLSKYLETHELPELTKRIIFQILTGETPESGDKKGA